MKELRNINSYGRTTRIIQLEFDKFKYKTSRYRGNFNLFIL